LVTFYKGNIGESVQNKFILGINYLTNSSCALMYQGEIVYVGQEERFQKFKNIAGFPHKALEYGLKKLNIDGNAIGKVGFSTKKFDPLLVKASLPQNLSIREFHDYYGAAFWQRQFRNEDCIDFYRWIRDADQFNRHEKYFDYSFINDDLLRDVNRRIDVYPEHLRKHLKDHFSIEGDIVQFLDHHTCHAYYGYFGSPFRQDRCAIITWDGIGDGRNQTVFIAENDKLVNVSTSSQNDIGRLYKMATLLVGMRPEEHEFKVMGMSPYAKGAYVDKAYLPLQNLATIENMRIVHNDRPRDLYSYLKDVWLEHRFDNISGAAQRFAEELGTRLFENIYRKQRIRRFVVSGGISMNIKLNKTLSELEFVDEIFICGSGGDESLSIGACYFLNQSENNNRTLTHLSLGYEVTEQSIKQYLKKLSREYEIREYVDEREVAQMLAQNEIVARVEGRAEFGARALGNRSILANPGHSDVVQQINEAIKNRDFWMPFALSVLEEYEDYCLVNPKNISSPFMSTGFDANPKNYAKFSAGTHPYDRSVRPQIVSQTHSASYHKLISEFRDITGVPALLNTSLNLHGQPIVNNIADAVSTLEKSGLKHLYIGKTLISKRF